MPLHKTINFNSSTQILVWKITETYAELFDHVLLNDSSFKRLGGMKSQLHQRGFLSVRKLLQEAGYNDFDLYYDEFGKPHLKDGKHISITHSYQFSAIIISDQTVGIDIELQQEKIIKIARKFNDEDCDFLKEDKKEDYIRKLTVIWGAKESIFKIRNERGISFKEHIKVLAFEIEDSTTVAELHFDNIVKDFNVCFEEIEDFTLVYAYEKE
jgi:4'-phosphopantetheinyl transferase